MYVITLRLAPAFSAHLARAGVMEAVAAAAREGRPPDVATLVGLGLPGEFVRLFVERLQYLLQLRQSGVLRSAGPFADLTEGLYLCDVADEAAARRILEDDPLYRAGFIENEYTVRRWLAAL
jgi:uncharacterized protein YciI